MRDLVEVHGLAKSIFNSLEVHRQFYCANSSSLKEITKSDHYSSVLQYFSMYVVFFFVVYIS